jgi:SSS family solute:Na+ symporter
MTPLIIIAIYLALLLGLGMFSSRLFKGTAADFFLASRGIGSFLLLMSLFGTTMTAFALVGSTGESFQAGIGVYGKLASSSGIIHSVCFFVVGIRLWALGKRYGYVTQIQFFRDRFASDKIGLVLFPALVGLVIPYLLVGVMSSGTVIQNITKGAFPGAFEATAGGIPYWLGAGVICVVVLVYVFFGGVRGTAWANAFQTIVFLILGIVTFSLIASKLGGPVNATKMVADRNPTKLQRSVHPDDKERYEVAMEKYEVALAAATTEEAKAEVMAKEPKKPHGITQLAFFTYLFIPLSVGMFPHLFQHWLTAKSAKSFRLSVVAHPLLIMMVWVPCVLIGAWATSAVVDGKLLVPAGANPNAVLSIIVAKLAGPILGGFLTAGILAAIMSSLDSQFLCLGSIFTNDIYGHYVGHNKLTDKQKVMIGRGFVIIIVAITYLIALGLEGTRGVFTLGVWCFSGFSSLFPLVMASLYWKRATKQGAYASIIAAGASWLILFAMSGFGADREYLVFGMMPVAVMTMISAAAMVIGSLMSPPPPEKLVRKFFPPKKLKTPEDSVVYKTTFP